MNSPILTSKALASGAGCACASPAFSTAATQSHAPSHPLAFTLTRMVPPRQRVRVIRVIRRGDTSPAAPGWARRRPEPAVVDRDDPAEEDSRYQGPAPFRGRADATRAYRQPAGGPAGSPNHAEPQGGWDVPSTGATRTRTMMRQGAAKLEALLAARCAAFRVVVPLRNGKSPAK